MLLRLATRRQREDDGPAVGRPPCTRADAGRAALQWAAVVLASAVLGAAAILTPWLPQRWGPILVLAALAPFAAMIVWDMRRLLLALTLLEIPFQLDINLGYREEAASLGAFGGLSLSVTTAALIGLYALWLLGPVDARAGTGHRAFRINLPLAAYLFCSTLSLAVARDATLGVYAVWMLLQVFLLNLYIANTIRSRREILFCVTLLLVGLLFESLVMIGLRATGQGIDIGGITTYVDRDVDAAARGSTRVGGTVGGPNHAAGYLTLLLAPAISILLTSLNRTYKWLAALAAGLGIVALIFTGSRGGWIAFLVSVAVLGVVSWRRSRLPLTLLAILVVVLTAVIFLLPGTISTRLTGDDGGAALSRVPLNRIALRMVEDNPLLGVGINNSAIVLKEYAESEPGRTWLYTVHNKYLLVWGEAGPLALLALVAFLLKTVRDGWRIWKLNSPQLSIVALGFAAAVVGHATHLFVEPFSGRPATQLLWLIAGLLVAMQPAATEPDPGG